MHQKLFWVSTSRSFNNSKNFEPSYFWKSFNTIVFCANILDGNKKFPQIACQFQLYSYQDMVMTIAKKNNIFRAINQYFSKNDYQKQETVPTIFGGYLINFFYSLFWLLRDFRDRKNLIEIDGRNSYSSESTDYKERFGGHGRTTGLIVSTNPLQQWRFRKCLTFSWTTLRDKYCRHPIAVMGVVDTFRTCFFSYQFE